MANKKISGLTSGNPAVTGDELPIARSGANFKVTAGSVAAINNPMTTAGDIVYGGASGAPTRLPAGTSSQVLVGGASAPSWGSTPSSALSTIPQPFGTVALPNITTAQIYSTNLSTGDHSLYTVPANKKAFATIVAHNASGVGAIVGTVTASFDGGSTWLIVRTGASVANAGTSLFFWTGFVFGAGDQIGIKTATNNGLNVFGTVYLFDSTSPLKTAKLTAFADGNNALYTVPIGKTAYTPYIYGQNATAPAMSATATSSNATTWNVVQNGGSVASTNRIYSSTIAANTNDGPNNPLSLNAGDFVNVAPTTGANLSLAFITVVEQ